MKVRKEKERKKRKQTDRERKDRKTEDREGKYPCTGEKKVWNRS